MKRYRLNENLLTERFVNLSNRDELSQYIDEIWDIMQESYKYLEGGFATASSKEELLDKVSFAKLVKKNNKIVAACLYKDKNGRKSIASGTDGSSEGKKWIMKLFQEDIKFGRSWAINSSNVFYDISINISIYNFIYRSTNSNIFFIMIYIIR